MSSLRFSTMMKIRSCLVLAAVIQADLDKCCPTPNLYSDEVMERCDFNTMIRNGSGFLIKSKGPKKLLPFCRDGICLMTNANLLKENGNVDFEKLDYYIDQWAYANVEFTDVILNAKKICIQETLENKWRSKLRPICAPDRLYVCLTSRILWSCNVKPFKECQHLQRHMDVCRPFYEK